MSFVLRPYQTRSINAARSAMAAGHRAVVLVAPTGSGKTVVFGEIARSAVAKGRRVLILAHRAELLTQAAGKLTTIEVGHGLISPHFPYQPDALVQIASVQTLARRLEKLDLDPDLIIIDECHLSIAAQYQAVVAAFPKAFLLGVTATPARLDGKGLGRADGGLYDALVQEVTMRELIAEGHLCRPRVFAPTQLDLSGLHTRAGDFAANEVAALVDKPKLIGDVVEHYRRLAHGRPSVAFCASREHAAKVRDAFRAAGYRAEMLDGTQETEHRAEIIHKLGSGEVDVVTNCQLLIEGVDQPAISCVMLLTPTKSLTRYLQSVGRGLRLHPGKSDCIVLDHANLVQTHGLPQVDRDWSLDASRKKRRSSREEEERLAVRQCPDCYHTHEATDTACPECGHVYPIKSRELEQAEGSLEEISEEEAEAMRVSRRREESRARTLDELIAIGQARGYKNPRAWARHRMAGRERSRQARPVSPPPEVQRHVPAAPLFDSCRYRRVLRPVGFLDRRNLRGRRSIARISVFA